MPIKFILIFVIIVISSCVTQLVEDPIIEAFHPKGFSISVRDSDGTETVTFHLNINTPLHRQDVGRFSQELSAPINGSWTFFEPRPVLNIGDVVYYWIAIVRNQIGYRKEGAVTITHKVYNGSSETTTDEIPGKIDAVTKHETQTEISVDAPYDARYLFCHQSLLDFTLTLKQLNAEIDAKITQNNNMLRWLENNGGRSITLGVSKELYDAGNKDDETLISTIEENLNITLRITSSERKGNSTIAFNVISVMDKVEILEAIARSMNDSIFFVP